TPLEIVDSVSQPIPEVPEINYGESAEVVVAKPDEELPGLRRLSRLRLRMRRTRAKHLPTTSELTEMFKPMPAIEENENSTSALEREPTEAPKPRKPKKVRIEHLDDDI